MRKLYSRGLAMTAGALVAVAGGAVAVTAATTTTTPATTTPAHHPHRWHHRPSTLIGKLTTYAAAAGTPGQAGSYGTVTITQPNGTKFTLNLTAHTKFLKFQGHGVKPTSMSGSSISSTDVVVVMGRDLFGKSTNPKARPVVGRILDLTQ
ncbi:MAG: hypothetical protein ACYCZN_12260 [Candidatus Dormibacteria bacterium]